MGDVPKPWSPSGFNPPYTEINRLLESLANLMYLIRNDATNPMKIEIYVSQAERCLERARVIVLDQMTGYSPN